LLGFQLCRRIAFRDFLCYVRDRLLGHGVVSPLHAFAKSVLKGWKYGQ
jgi:hypothetical protein